MPPIQHILSAANRLAYQQFPASAANVGKPGVLFLTGFRSDMSGSKATALAQWAEQAGVGFTRFDYSGHGQSEGKFTDGCIGSWLNDASLILNQVCQGPQIVVGSSMGGWIMLHLALRFPQKVRGLVGIASAPDFTEELIWNVVSQNIRDQLLRGEIFYEPSVYDPEPTPITPLLIEDGRKHLLLNRDQWPIHCPVRLIHGANDTDVPWKFSEKILDKVAGADVHLHLIKDADHRLNRPGDIGRILSILESLISVSCRPERSEG